MQTPMDAINLVSTGGPVCVLPNGASLVLASQSTAPSASAVTPEPVGEREQGFKPHPGGADLQSGELLLIEAYAAIWLMAFLLILHTWRKQRQLASRLDQLEQDIEEARDGGPSDAGDTLRSE